VAAPGAPRSLPPPVCVPAPEQCNGLDDDCDGVVDKAAQRRFRRATRSAINHWAIARAAQISQNLSDNELLLG